MECTHMYMAIVKKDRKRPIFFMSSVGTLHANPNGIEYR